MNVPMRDSGVDSDERLCVCIKQGDAGAFRELFDKYYGALYRFLCHRGMEPVLAEDMAQEVFVRVWKNRGNLKPAKSLLPYLFQAGMNEIRMYLRKKKVRDAYASEVQQQAVRYSVPISNFDQKEYIEKAIHALPASLQEVFVLHRYDGLSYKEIAALQDVSVKTVESRMSKALKRLRAELQHLVKLALGTMIWFQ